MTDTVVPPTTTATASATAPPVSGPKPCATVNLSVTLGANDGAAGSTYYPVHFTNRGAASCMISGFPGVSFVAPGNGKQVGAPAVRSAGNNGTVTLASGSEATAVLQVANYQAFSAGACAPVAVSGFRVYPPGNTAATYVALPGAQKACSKDLSSTGSNQLVIRAVKAGSTGQ